MAVQLGKHFVAKQQKTPLTVCCYIAHPRPYPSTRGQGLLGNRDRATVLRTDTAFFDILYIMNIIISGPASQVSQGPRAMHERMVAGLGNVEIRHMR